MNIFRTLKLCSLFFTAMSSLNAYGIEIPTFCSDPDYLIQDCASSEGVFLETNFCLEKYHACGHYQDIIQHYASLAYGSTHETARYFKGLSYYGLYVRNGSQSLKCQYARQARSELYSYLYLKMETGYTSQTDFKRVFESTKVLKDLKSLDSCMEPGLSEEEFAYKIQSYSDEMLNSIFVGSTADSLGGIAEFKSDVQTTIGLFITRAADIETQLKVKEVAMESAYRRFDSIFKIYDDTVGTTDYTYTDGMISSLSYELEDSSGAGYEYKTALEKAAQWKENIDEKSTEIDTAMGNVNINEYDQKRQEIVQDADETVAYGAIYADFSRDAIPSESIEALRQTLNASGGAAASIGRIQDTLSQVEDSYRNGGLYFVPWDCSEYYNPTAWYCGTQTMFNLIVER